MGDTPAGDGNVTWGDGDNLGTVIGGGNSGDIFVGPGIEKPQSYSRRRVRLLPITERGLQVASALTTFAVFFTGYQSFTQVRDAIRVPGTITGPETEGLVWIYAFLSLACFAALVLAMLRTVHNRTHHYSRFTFLPGMAGVRDRRGTLRLSLVQNQGTCQICGGRLRFYAKVTEWHEEIDHQTRRRRRVVDERTPVAECVRNPRKHVWPMDPTDTDDLDFQV